MVSLLKLVQFNSVMTFLNWRLWTSFKEYTFIYLFFRIKLIVLLLINIKGFPSKIFTHEYSDYKEGGKHMR